MEFNVEELRAYIKAFNSIHVDTPEEHNEMIKILHGLGFKIGYTNNGRFAKFHYISLGTIERDCIHTSLNGPMRYDKEIVEYKDLPVRFPMDKTFSCASPAELLTLLQMA